MCGRYSFSLTKEQVHEHFERVEISQMIRPSYNIAPTQHAYIITNDQPNKLQYINWGLVPYWAKTPENKGRLINARMEGIESKPSFRMPIREKRCLVLADSFYEWRRIAGQKTPYRITLKDSPIIVMAGIWDAWNNNGYSIKTFSIITAPANEEMGLLHSRMPVIFSSKEEENQWLSDISLTKAKTLLRSLKSGSLSYHQVSTRLNKVGNNDPELHQELPETPDLFS